MQSVRKSPSEVKLEVHTTRAGYQRAPIYIRTAFGSSLAHIRFLPNGDVSEGWMWLSSLCQVGWRARRLTAAVVAMTFVGEEEVHRV